MTIALKSKAVDTVDAVKDVHPVERARKLSLGKFVPNAVSVRSSRVALRVQHKSPQLLFGAGIVLGVATVVTACKATLELEGVLDDIKSDVADVRELTAAGKFEQPDANKMEKYIKAKGAAKIGKLYAPSVGLGVLAVASLTGSHHIMNKRNIAITAAYSTMEKAFDEYRGRVADKYGEEAERDIRLDMRERVIVEDTPNGPKKKTVKVFGANGGSPYARVWDEVTSKNWRNNAYSNRTFIQCQQQWANDMLQSKGHLFLNEVHDLLGLERTAAGQRVGWFLGNGDSVVDFGIFDRMHSDERVHEFMFGEEKSVLLDFNVDGDVYQLLDAHRTNEK